MLTQYTQGWGAIGERQVKITASDDGIPVTVDENINGDRQGCLYRYTYVAPPAGTLTVSYEALDAANTWHHYAFSNEVAVPVYLDPEPYPGSQVSIDAKSPLRWILNGPVDQPLYHLTVAADASLQTPIVDVNNLSETVYNVPLSPETDYYWQVKVIEQDTCIYTSPVWTFTTLPVPPDAVKLLEWKFDCTEGTVAAQTGSVSGADGLLMGFNTPDSAQSRVKGLLNHALYLDGADEHVDVSSAFSYMPTAEGQSFAISGYLCTYDDYGPLFSMRNAQDETPIIDIALGADGIQVNAGQICVLTRDNAGSMKTMNSGMTVNDGRWHHFLLTRADDDWTLMIDGQIGGTMENAAAGQLSLNRIGIGASLKWIADDWQPHNSHYRYFNGIVDEFTVWSGRLRPHQIDALIQHVPPQGDVNWDHVTNLADTAAMAADWRLDTITPAQPLTILEDMESYLNNPASFEDHWAYTPEAEYGNLMFSLQPDPAGLYGQALLVSYDFNGKLHAHVPFRLRERRVDLSLYDRLYLRLRKSAGCDVSKIILDFYDGRYNSDPITDGMHNKGRLILDIADVPEQLWQDMQVPIPNSIDFTSCRDLYQLVISLEDGGDDRGTIWIDEMALTDDTDDCRLRAGQVTTDINGDCRVDVADLLMLTQSWLAPSN